MMPQPSRCLLSALAATLSLWLIVGYWPLSTRTQVILVIVTVMLLSLDVWRQWRAERSRLTRLSLLSNGTLPPEEFLGAVVLVVGDSSALFPSGAQSRESGQGWYIRVESADQMGLLAQHLAAVRPALIDQVSILLALMPEQHNADDDFALFLRFWLRTVVQGRRWLGNSPPFWMAVWLSPLSTCARDGEHPWFILTHDHPKFEVSVSAQGTLPLAEWLRQKHRTELVSRLGHRLWLQAALDCIRHHVHPRLLASTAWPLCAYGICMASAGVRPHNLWQRHITDITTLPPVVQPDTALLPLPDAILLHLPVRREISHRMHIWRKVGGLSAVFLTLALLASFFNNQRLVRSIQDHLVLYHGLSGQPPTPKIQAQQQLRADRQQLDDWQREGEPMRYGLGLYQGARLSGPLDAAIRDWAPPPAVSTKAVTPPIHTPPEMIRLAGLSLFATGQWQLKPQAYSVLMQALIDIRTKPGWLIMVTGHTDNSGNEQANQRLSMKRAEAVRDWMRDTGNVPESCFAVQGAGSAFPVAANDTPEGRAANRRVEIRLAPQANACLLPDVAPPSSRDDDGYDN